MPIYYYIIIIGKDVFGIGGSILKYIITIVN